MCRLRPSFFGLPLDANSAILSKLRVNRIWEPEFLLKYYSNLSIQEVRNMPISKREWWVDRVQRELNKDNSGGGTQNAPKQASPAQNQTQNVLKKFEAMLAK